MTFLQELDASPAFGPPGATKGGILTAVAWFGGLAVMLTAILLTGCATAMPECNMSRMSAAQVERALVYGCGN